MPHAEGRVFPDTNLHFVDLSPRGRTLMYLIVRLSIAVLRNLSKRTRGCMPSPKAAQQSRRLRLLKSCSRKSSSSVLNWLLLRSESRNLARRSRAMPLPLLGHRMSSPKL